MLYTQITGKKNNEKMIALLFDPDKSEKSALKESVAIAEEADIDFFLLGGSIISTSLHDKISVIKQGSAKPVFLLPGNLLQLSTEADGIFLLSLISGRNPDYLIGNHVNASQLLKKSKLEIIPTGYMLIETGKRTSVEYMSNTIPIPSDKPEIAVATAIAGEMLGLKLIYLEGGSGAECTINTHLIREVKKNISIPLCVGGGIRSATAAREIFEAGADIVIIGTVAEENMQTIREIAKAKTDGYS